MRTVAVTIIVDDRGGIKVNAVGPYSDNQSLVEILKAAQELAEQGRVNVADLQAPGLGHLLPGRGAGGICASGLYP
jgi:hypothetical protein